MRPGIVNTSCIVDGSMPASSRYGSLPVHVHVSLRLAVAKLSLSKFGAACSRVLPGNQQSTVVHTVRRTTMCMHCSPEDYSIDCLTMFKHTVLPLREGFIHTAYMHECLACLHNA